MDDTTPLYSKSRPARIYELNSSSSNFFPADTMSSTKDFILAMYSTMVDDPFWVVARAILVFITLARDWDMNEVSMCFYTSTADRRATTWMRTSRDMEVNR
jgi:hypothetical protein